MLAAENLDAGGKQCPVADDDPAEDAVAANLHAGTDARLGVGEVRSEGMRDWIWRTRAEGVNGLEAAKFGDRRRRERD
jgi:hypothetical protein